MIHRYGRQFLKSESTVPACDDTVKFLSQNEMLIQVVDCSFVFRPLTHKLRGITCVYW